MSGAERRLLAREWTLSAIVAAGLAGVLIWLGPPGVDLAAHSYQRTFLLQHGFAIWNNFWYAGRYSFVTYSFIYYPLAALIGIKLLAVVSIGVAALAFALVVWQEWGPSARFSSRTFMLLWPGVVLSAAFPFALGAMFALLAIAALQHGRRRLFALLLFLTLLASPLALLLLVLVLAGGAVERPPRRATVAVIVIAVAIELILRRLFPTPELRRRVEAAGEQLLNASELRVLRRRHQPHGCDAARAARPGRRRRRHGVPGGLAQQPRARVRTRPASPWPAPPRPGRAARPRSAVRTSRRRGT